MAELPVDEQIRGEVERGLAVRLLAFQPVGLLAQLAAMAAAVALLRGAIPDRVVVSWAAVIVLFTTVRAFLVHRAERRQFPLAKLLRVTRVAVAGHGLAWSLGAVAVLAQRPPVVDVVLVLCILATLCAGGGTTFAADALTYRLYLLTMLVPALAWEVIAGHSQLDLILAVLIGCGAVFMLILNGGAYQILAEHLQTAALLERSERRARAERAQLDALIVSAPLAVAVLDREARIRHVNPQFESLFGFRLAEVVGRRLPDMLVPEADAEVVKDYVQRVRGGEIVRVEVVRLRNDGGTVEVRMSAAAVRESPDGGTLVLYEDISDRKTAEREQARLIEELRAALASVKTLRGLLPICASCKKIRDDGGYWSQIDVYVRDHSDAEFSHGICPDCASRLYGDLAEEERPGLAGG